MCGGTSLSGALRKSASLLLSVMALLIEFLVYIDWLYVCSSLPCNSSSLVLVWRQFYRSISWNCQVWNMHLASVTKTMILPALFRPVLPILWTSRIGDLETS